MGGGVWRRQGLVARWMRGAMQYESPTAGWQPRQVRSRMPSALIPHPLQPTGPAFFLGSGLERVTYEPKRGLVLTPVAKYHYFVAPAQWSILDLLKNPMVRRLCRHCSSSFFFPYCYICCHWAPAHSPHLSAA